jgi:O-antigen ligase
MTDQPDARPSLLAPNAFDVRGAVFVAFLAVAWISLRPFGDLGSPDNLDISTGRDFALYAVFAVFAAVTAFLVWDADRPALKALGAPSFLILIGWIGLTCLTSHDPATSIKRVAMLVSALASTATLFLLPRNKSHMVNLLSVVAMSVIGLSYFGVIFLPQYSIHQATDLVEPRLAGDWRGLFDHKNQAAAMFSMLSFIGVFIARSSRPLIGWAICILSLVFVLNSGGKSSTLICMATIAISVTAANVRNPVLWSLLVFSPLVLLNLLGVGSALSPWLASLTAWLPLDTTFTGRTGIWAFAAAKAAEYPVFGYGFSAFWNTEALRYGVEDTTNWAGQASHAHNAYLDAALGMGLPGLAATLFALVAQPARDLRRAARLGRDPALLLMLSQIWLFGLYLASLESLFFNRENPTWLTFLFALFGFRYLAAFSVKH